MKLPKKQVIELIKSGIIEMPATIEKLEAIINLVDDEKILIVDGDDEPNDDLEYHVLKKMRSMGEGYISEVKNYLVRRVKLKKLITSDDSINDAAVILARNGIISMTADGRFTVI
jgi:hypothetical protein